MKKYAGIAAVSFLLGILAAGYVFVYVPEKKSARGNFANTATTELSSSLFAASAASAIETRSDLDFVGIAEKVGPAVVKIEVEKVQKIQGFGMEQEMPFDDFWNRFFGQPRQRDQEFKSAAQGTGFFLSEDGYILTNNHIAENAVKVTVTTLQGQDLVAKVAGTDPRTDLALLKVEGKGFPFVQFGDSAAVKVGEWVLAIGNPFGLEHTVTAGIVSAKGRQLGLGGNVPEYQDFIQTDAAINRGNSGGPLVNMKGEVIGITSNILAPAGGNIGLGFAIPSNMAKKVVTQLREKGRVVRGRIGVSMKPEPLSDEDRDAFKLKDKKGALVTEVMPGGPADKAGLKKYDVIVEFNGQKVDSPNDLKFKVADIQPGSKANIKVVRDGKEQSFTVTVEEYEPVEGKAKVQNSDKDLGFSVRELDPNLARRFGVKTQRGLIITDVKEYSEAARKGLAAGDIILEVNRQPVETVDDLDRILKRAQSGQAIILLVRQEGEGGSVDRIFTLRVP
jgi:serine protease Do